MSHTQRQAHSKDTTLRILTIGSLDGSMMHFHHHLTEVQSDASSLDMQGTCCTRLIETVEDLMYIALDTHAVVDDLQKSILMITL